MLNRAFRLLSPACPAYVCPSCRRQLRTAAPAQLNHRAYSQGHDAKKRKRRSRPGIPLIRKVTSTPSPFRKITNFPPVHVRKVVTREPFIVRRYHPSPSNRAAVDINSFFKARRAETDDTAKSNAGSTSPGQDIAKDFIAALRAKYADSAPSKEQKGGKPAARVKGIKRITSDRFSLQPVTDVGDQPPVPRLHHGLDRVLFNPGVYQLQDPRTRVFNFDPYLHKILPVSDFDFKALQEYETSSRDATLGKLAETKRMKYYGSTSSMTGMLRHLHFLLSQNRPLNFSMLTQGFEVKSKTYSRIATVPAAVFLRYRDGRYAIDADKFFDSTNVMSLLGHSLEKLLTVPVDEFERYKLSNREGAEAEQDVKRNTYHYTTFQDILMRSQLDAQDPRLPGTGVFDVKTRAVVSVRAHAWVDHRPGLGYELRGEHGQWESFEREQYDMLRTTMLSYSLQARMGRMDGIFAAYHNVERIFGFQYLSLADMDQGLHGQRDPTVGDAEFKLSLALLKNIFDAATAKFPKQSLRMHFETLSSPPFLFVFIEPVSEEDVEAIQTRNKEQNARITRRLLGVDTDNDDVEPEAEEADAWSKLRAQVEADVANEPSKTPAELFDEPADSTDEADVVHGETGLSFEHQLLRLQVVTEKLNKDVQVTRAEFESYEDLTIRSQRRVNAEARVRIVLASMFKLEDRLSGLQRRIVEDQGDASELLVFVDQIKRTVDERILELADVTNRFVSAAKPAPEEATEPKPDGPQQRPATSLSDANKPLLALTVSVRNKVNNEPVRRPERLAPADEWAVEYAVDEVKDAGHARILYGACLARRREQLGSDEGVAWGLLEFRKEVAKWAVRGREWRAEQDEAEGEREPVVFEPMGEKGA